jgi:hypothetical protein
MAQKLVKKVIVTSNLKGKTETDLLKAVNDRIQAALNNTSIVPALNPTPAQMQTKTQNYATLLVTRDTLRAQQKQNTALILQAEADILNNINSQWVPYIQQQIAGDISKAKLLGFGVKGIDNGQADELVEKAAETHPIISRTDVNVHLQHALYITNSRSGKNKLPADAKHIEIYEQIGGTAPTSIKTMVHAGIAKKGKFINHFDDADLGKTVYYIAVYIDKKTLQPLEQSPVVSAMIN